MMRQHRRRWSPVRKSASMESTRPKRGRVELPPELLPALGDRALRAGVAIWVAW